MQTSTSPSVRPSDNRICVYVLGVSILINEVSYPTQITARCWAILTARAWLLVISQIASSGELFLSLL